MRLTVSYLLAVSLACATWSGCFIYFDDDKDDCLFGGEDGSSDGAAEPALGLRNPETGQCEYFGGGGGGGPICDDHCGPCPEPGPAPGPVPDPAPLPSWGYCESECTYLDEGSCLDTSGCRGIYGADGVFAACWSVDQAGPIQGGECEGLDAWSCSLHDDCVAIHQTPCAAEGDQASQAPIACDVGEFLACGDEAGNPPHLCYGVPACDTPPPDCPPGTLPTHDTSCYTGQCVPESDCEDPPPPACADIADESQCIARPECTPLYQGEDCSCDAMGCGCNAWIFTGCQ